MRRGVSGVGTVADPMDGGARWHRGAAGLAGRQGIISDTQEFKDAEVTKLLRKIKP